METDFYQDHLVNPRHLEIHNCEGRLNENVLCTILIFYAVNIQIVNIDRATATTTKIDGGAVNVQGCITDLILVLQS